MEMFYDYKTFDDIKTFLDPLTIKNLDFKVQYSPDGYKKNGSIGDHYIDSDGYLISTIFYKEEYQITDDVPFNYKTNSHGFRSQHFKKLDNNDINILYSGCSWTFGEGLPYDFLWTTLLTNKIKNYHKDKNVEEFNIGGMGSSIHLIVRNIMSFVRNYGTPDYIFINFPDIARNIMFDDVLKRYINVYFASRHLESKMEKTQLKYTKNYSHEDSVLIASDFINMLESFCESSGIKLIWTTWAYNDVPLYRQLSFKYFMDTDTEFEQYRIVGDKQKKTEYYKNTLNYPYWRIARDNNHPGTCWTNHSSGEFYNEFIKRYDNGGIWNEDNKKAVL